MACADHLVSVVVRAAAPDVQRGAITARLGTWYCGALLDVSPTARAGDAQQGAPRVPLLTLIASRGTTSPSLRREGSEPMHDHNLEPTCVPSGTVHL